MNNFLINEIPYDSICSEYVRGSIESLSLSEYGFTIQENMAQARKRKGVNDMNLWKYDVCDSEPILQHFNAYFSIS